MATYDRSFEALRHYRVIPEPRAERRLSLSWGAVFGGVVIGWGTFLLLSTVGGAIGLASFDPFNPDWSGLGVGAAIWGLCEMALSAFIGGFIAARICGDRRRREVVLHGATAWGVSMVGGALMALMLATVPAAATSAASSRAAVVHRADGTVTTRHVTPTSADRARASDAADTASKAGGAAAAGSVLALLFSLLGALLAGAQMSGMSLADELKPPRKTAHKPVATYPGSVSTSPMATRRDEPTILPPTH